MIPSFIERFVFNVIFCLPCALQASTGYGVDPSGNGYGQPELSLEEAIDLAESEVQGIVSLVNVVFTDQVRASPGSAISRLLRGINTGLAMVEPLSLRRAARSCLGRTLSCRSHAADLAILVEASETATSTAVALGTKTTLSPATVKSFKFIVQQCTPGEYCIYILSYTNDFVIVCITIISTLLCDHPSFNKMSKVLVYVAPSPHEAQHMLAPWPRPSAS